MEQTACTLPLTDRARPMYTAQAMHKAMTYTDALGEQVPDIAAGGVAGYLVGHHDFDGFPRVMLGVHTLDGLHELLIEN